MAKLTYSERFRKAVGKARRHNKPPDLETPSLAAAQEAVIDAFELFAQADKEIARLKGK